MKCDYDSIESETGIFVLESPLIYEETYDVENEPKILYLESQMNKKSNYR